MTRCREIWDKSDKQFHTYILDKYFYDDFKDTNAIAKKKFKEFKPQMRKKLCIAIRENDEDYAKAKYEAEHDL